MFKEIQKQLALIDQLLLKKDSDIKNTVIGLQNGDIYIHFLNNEMATLFLVINSTLANLETIRLSPNKVSLKDLIESVSYRLLLLSPMKKSFMRRDGNKVYDDYSTLLYSFEENAPYSNEELELKVFEKDIKLQEKLIQELKELGIVLNDIPSLELKNYKFNLFYA